MKLFLASEIKHPKSIERLKEFIGDNINKELTYIPTAANSEFYFGKWKEGSTYKIISKLFKRTNVLELEFVDDEKSKKIIENTEVLFLAGGFPVYLLYWLKRRGLSDLIKDRVVKNKMILLGSSAGAMVCSKTVKVATTFESDPFAEVVPGLGLIDFEIFPHYDDKQIELLKKFETEVIPLKNGEQIIIEE